MFRLLKGNVRQSAVVSLLVCLLGVPCWARGQALTQVYRSNEKAQLVIFGNTLGYDCNGAKAPKAGTVDSNLAAACLIFSKPGIESLWKSEVPSIDQSGTIFSGTAQTSGTITPGEASSTAIFNFPKGAVNPKVRYARLVWAAKSSVDGAALEQLTLHVPNPAKGMNIPLVINSEHLYLPSGTTTTPDGEYQASVDITSILQMYGPGAYHVSNMDISDPRNITGAFAAWAVFAIIQSDDAPLAQFNILEGLDPLQTNMNTASYIFNSFTTPATIPLLSSSLGFFILAPSNSASTDAKFNGMDVIDALNPRSKLANQTFGVLGTMGPAVGDLPQMDGAARTMPYFDLDLIDISQLVTGNLTSATLTLKRTSGSYFVGVIAASIPTISPNLGTSAWRFSSLTDTPCDIRAGNKITALLRVANSGAGRVDGLTATVTLPLGGMDPSALVMYEPNSLKTGMGMGGLMVKTDVASDDEAEINPAAMLDQLTARLGLGATKSTGGSLGTGENAQIQLTVNVPQSAKDGQQYQFLANLSGRDQSGQPVLIQSPISGLLIVGKTDLSCSQDQGGNWIYRGGCQLGRFGGPSLSWMFFLILGVAGIRQIYNRRRSARAQAADDVM